MDPVSRVDLAHGLPVNADAERFVLGSILMDDMVYPAAAADLSADDFSLEKHRRIWRRMANLQERGERIDRVTVANELHNHDELEACGGLSYLVSLDDGLPQIPNLDSYVRILHDKGTRRRIMYACRDINSRCASECEDLRDIIDSGQELFTGIPARAQGSRSIADIPSVRDCAGGEVAYIREPELPRGSLVALTGDASSGKSTLATAWARDAAVPVLILDRENPLAIIRERLARLGSPDGPMLRIWGGWLTAEAPLPDAAVVVDWVRTSDPKPLVIIDSLSAFYCGDQNDAGEMRIFLHRCRRLADLGATALLIHHEGKADTAKDYRGSSDFKAAIDCGYHVANFGGDGRLDKLVLRCFKSRFGFSGELSYEYAGGRFVRCKAAESQEAPIEQLRRILRLQPGITARQFEELANTRGLGRNRARNYLADGVLSGAIQRQTGPGKTKRHYLSVSEGSDAD
jgi:KaiC/GvpD/RAD55 family RecA-like ATPase